MWANYDNTFNGSYVLRVLQLIFCISVSHLIAWSCVTIIQMHVLDKRQVVLQPDLAEHHSLANIRENKLNKLTNPVYKSADTSPTQNSTLRTDSLQGRSTSSTNLTKKPSSLWNFKFTLQPRNLCSKTSHVNKDSLLLLVYIHSAPRNFARRRIVRETWGDRSQFPQLAYRYFFVTGMDVDPRVNEVLEDEANHFGDILQANFTENYYNLTYKAVSALHWLDDKCSLSDKIKFILKSDDDMVVNLPVLINHLSTHLSRGLDNMLIQCHVWRRPGVMRRGKNSVTLDEYRYRSYPSFCSGSAFIMSYDVISLMKHASDNTPFYKLDDVYLTGFLVTKIPGLKLEQIGEFYSLRNENVEYLFNLSTVKRPVTIFAHAHNERRIKNAWKIIMSKGRDLPLIKSIMKTDSNNFPKLQAIRNHNPNVLTEKKPIENKLNENTSLAYTNKFINKIPRELHNTSSGVR